MQAVIAVRHQTGGHSPTERTINKWGNTAMSVKVPSPRSSGWRLVRLVALAAVVLAASAAPPVLAPFIGTPAVANPVGAPSPQHPHLAVSASNAMHGDSYNSGSHGPTGPLGNATTVSTWTYGALCAAQEFDTAGHLFTVCGSLSGFMLQALDPQTGEVIARQQLPNRVSTQQAQFTLDLQLIYNDTSGGAYFFLDDQERVVLVDADQNLRVFRLTGNTFTEDASYPLVSHLSERDCFDLNTNPFPSGHCDVVTSVMPDWSGRYWWVSRRGIVGTVDPVTGQVSTTQLPGEEIENSVAVDSDGVYVLSDHAQYMMTADPSGTPTVEWREEYDHSGGIRPGQVSLGSGTTPTLVGSDLLAIADGADPVRVVIMKRGASITGPRTMCTMPVFNPGASAAENSLTTDGDGTAVVVQNTYGYSNPNSLPYGATSPGGVTKIEIDRGSDTCNVAWTNPTPIPSSTMKLSRGAGLIYGYSKRGDSAGRDVWYWTAIDWRTGATVYQVLAGATQGLTSGLNSNWGVVSIGPDGTAYMGILDGLLKIQDH